MKSYNLSIIYFLESMTILVLLDSAVISMARENKSVCLSGKNMSLYVNLSSDVLLNEYVNEEQNILIICPFVAAKLYYNGNLLSYDRTFVLEGFKAENAGTYSCLSQDNVNETNWANLTLFVCEKNLTSEYLQLKLTDELSNDFRLPQFKIPIQLSKYVEKHSGGLAVFTCLPLGNTLPNVTWSYNGSPLNLLKTKYKIKKYSLYVDDLSKNESGTYECQLCNEVGCVTQSTILNVIDRLRSRPVIRSGTPANRTVFINENVDFECQVLSDIEPHIIWLKHNVNLNMSSSGHLDLYNNPNIVKLPTSADEPYLLRLGSVQLEDEGYYTCVAKNNLGEAISSAFLKILINNNLKNIAVNVTESKTLEKFTGETDPNIKLSNNEETDDNDMLNYKVEQESVTRFKYVKKIDDSDIEQEAKSSSNEDAPQFKNTKKLEENIHKPSGSSVQLVCPATGNPTPIIKWTRNNTEIERTIGRVSYKKWSIQMDDATTEDSGLYKCTICNKLGCIEHATKVTIRDRLRSPPIISDKFPQNQTVLVHNSTYLECRVVSDLEPSIKWFRYAHQNVPIKQLEQVALKLVNKIPPDNSSLLNNVIALTADPDRPNILNFTNVTHREAGWYTCVASNTLGHSLASAYMNVVDKLPRDSIFRGHPVWITAVAIVVVLLFLLGTVFIIYVLRKLKHEKLLKQRIETVHQWTKKVIIYRPAATEGSSCDLQMPVIKIEKQRTTFTTSSSDPVNGFNEYEFPLDSNWEIPRSQLILGSILGEGAFGRVVMAEASDLSSTTLSTMGNTPTIVAVKMVKEEHTDVDMTSLVHEMEVMKLIGKHINIINLVGCCSQNGPLWVIVEFAPHGNLKDFLKKNRPLSGWGNSSLEGSGEYLEDKPQLTEKHLVSFAFQIARGMDYLASRRCIHRDLAARNVLVSNDYVMKIADFGLARDVQDTDYYRKKTNGRLPIKWMAPESLQDKFYDSKSDVWSYGVLLWEIMTYGDQPYPNIMCAEELYSFLITGQRMEKPSRCSLNIYMLMRQCWHFDSNARPTFSEIVENLDKILQLSSITPNEEYLDLSIPMLETPPSSSDEESEPETFQETSPLRYQYTYKFN
ncbi:fibroblast growth factor receptor homolog 1 [Glossina fuscipes]|uniref:receptor protein-tyrosine kinase n=1 Tax=Glossina fuscipes TaxID=7396 RepID=A0A8U0W3M0_9MUSC|nr:fibroblast growth factor receptor homolog 1 [Glossina fuscipes]KAI9588083.1 hypothetical protein GQX74_003929 [Glossina fuscipes]